MADAPAFSFYASDFMVGTIAMSLAERGAYITLLCYQWDRGSVPDTPAELARVLGCPLRQVPALWQALAARFPVGPDGRRQNLRLEEERQKQVARRAKLAENGRRGGRPKKPDGSDLEKQDETNRFDAPETNRFDFAEANGNQNKSLSSSFSGTPSVPYVQKRERVPPQKPATAGRSRSLSLTAPGEALRFDEAQQRLHTRCHREVCTYWTTTPTVRVCLSSAQVAQFASKLVKVPEAERVPTVIRWAQQHVPTVAELPANLMRYWDAQWDARATAAARPSAVPSAAETRAYHERMAARARS